MTNELDRLESELYNTFKKFLQMDDKSSLTPVLLAAKSVRMQVERILNEAKKDE